MKHTGSFLRAFLLALIVAIGLMAGMSATVHAETQNPIQYIDADGSTKSCTEYTLLSNTTSIPLDGGWYVVNSNVTFSSRISASGDVHIILCDGCTLYANSSIDNNIGNLTIYGQTGNEGKLIAKYDNAYNNYAIRARNNGNVTINGGTVTATGFYSGIFSDGGKVTINGGKVTAEPTITSGQASGISGSTGVEINGGSVTATATSSTFQAYGIYSVSGDVTIKNSTVTATGNTYGIWPKAGDCTIKDSTVSIIGNTCGFFSSGNVTIDGGTVDCEGKGNSGTGLSANGLEITAGTVTIKGGRRSLSADNLTIANGLTVKAGASEDAAVVTTDYSNIKNSTSYQYVHVEKALTPVTIGAAAKEVRYSPADIDIPVAGMFTIPEGVGEATYTVTNDSGEGTYSGNKLTVTKCGTFTVTVSTAATDTYAAGTETATLTVSKAGITPTVTLDGWMYGGTASGENVTGNTGNGSVTYTYKVKGDDDSTYSKTRPTNAGTYTVKATIAETDNYESGEATAEFTIARKPVTVSGITASDKVYDGTTTATLITSNATLTGKVDDDLTFTATGAFADKNVGANKAITISGLTLGGDSAGNYQLAASGNQTSTTASITAREITVSGITASDKVYDGTTTATLDTNNATLTGKVDDTLTVTANGTFADKNVGANKEVTISGLALSGTSAGNYRLAASGNQTTATASITARGITVSGITASDKVYDGTTTATLITSNATLTGKVDDDLTFTATGAFADKNVGANKEVTISGLALSGTSAVNYQLAESGQQTSTTASISQKTLTVTADAKSKTYGEDDPALTYSQSGLVGEDTITGALSREVGEDVIDLPIKT